MKLFRVTVTEEYLVPDDWEIISRPEDQILCLHGDGQHFLPDLRWSERVAFKFPGKVASLPRAYWQTVGGKRGDRFIGQCQTQTAAIREIQ